MPAEVIRHRSRGEPMVIRCSCKREVELWDPMTNECDCGALWNGSGQALRPESEWEEHWDDG